MQKRKLFLANYQLYREVQTIYFFNRLVPPIPTKPRIRSVKDKVGTVDAISVLSMTSSTVPLSRKYEDTASNTMGGINTVPNPIQSITTEMIDVVEEIVDLFTY